MSGHGAPDQAPVDCSGLRVAVVGFHTARWANDVADLGAAQRLVRDAKGAHQAPKEIHLVDALPVTLVGKIDKKRLRAMGAEIGAEGGDR